MSKKNVKRPPKALGYLIVAVAGILLILSLINSLYGMGSNLSFLNFLIGIVGIFYGLYLIRQHKKSK